jgi:predicted nuclease with TOPRIM domain
MPLGLWKSKWEIHREDMARQREEAERRSAEHDKKMARLTEESERRSAEHREKMDRFYEEMREERAAAESRWLQLGEETGELREKYDRELAEARRFNREMLTRLEKTYAHLGTALGVMGDEVIAMRGEIHELKGAVDAQTEAIMKLVDRFEDPEGRPPV